VEEGRKGDRQVEELGLGCPGTSFFHFKHCTQFCIAEYVRNIPFAAHVVYRTGVSGDDFWQVIKTDDRRAGIRVGRQPTQVFSRPCRRTQSVLELRRNV